MQDPDWEEGKLVFVSSVAGLFTFPQLGADNAGKYVLEAIVQSLRDELKPMGVSVAAINPGSYKTGFNDRVYNSYLQWFDEDFHFTPKEKIEEAAKNMAQNQFDPQEMIDKMVEVIPSDSHEFRTILLKDFVEMSKKYQNN